VKVICSYCRKEIGIKKPLDDDSVSHGICKECIDYYQKQINGLSLNQYLDRFEIPVFIADDHGRIVAANNMAETMTGKSPSEIFGLLGGEVMECAYARLPEGCGETVHCAACSIRRTVMAAMESGEPQMHVPVKLHQEDREIEMIISTEKIGSFVRIVIENRLMS
jgi:PAS domain-containing protein